jgi:putative membrane protein
LVEHSSFIFFGCLMWMPIFGPLPKPTWFTAAWKVGYVIAVRFAGAILGNVLMWSGTVLYPKYAAGEAYWNISPLADQSTAGVVMMIEGTFLGLGLLAWVFFEVSREGIEKQRLLDLALEQGVELDEARAQRAVAAGQAERLERQLVGSGGEGDDRPG